MPEHRTVYQRFACAWQNAAYCIGAEIRLMCVWERLYEPGLGRATPKQMKVHFAFLGFPEWNRHGFIKVKYMHASRKCASWLHSRNKCERKNSLILAPSYRVRRTWIVRHRSPISTQVEVKTTARVVKTSSLGIFPATNSGRAAVRQGCTATAPNSKTAAKCETLNSESHAHTLLVPSSLPAGHPAHSF